MMVIIFGYLETEGLEQLPKYRTKDEFKIHNIWDRRCTLRPSSFYLA